MSAHLTLHNRTIAPPGGGGEGHSFATTDPVPVVGLAVGDEPVAVLPAADSAHPGKRMFMYTSAATISQATASCGSPIMNARDRMCFKHFLLMVFAAVFMGVIVVTYLWESTAADSIDPITGVVRLYSFHYFVYCFLGGLSSGLIHLFLTPIDVVKCRIQVGEYCGFRQGFTHMFFEAGGSVSRALPLFFCGWLPTVWGYSLQASSKFFLYEVLKVVLMETTTTTTAEVRPAISTTGVGSTSPPSSAAHGLVAYQFFIFLLSSFLAEVVADLFLAPWEAVKIRMQTSPSFPLHLRIALPRMWEAEGLHGFYKGLVPLWCRQVPHNVIKLSSFEFFVSGVQFTFQYTGVIDTAAPSAVDKLVVSFVAGALAGVVCGIVSHPADTVLSKLNQKTCVQTSNAAPLLANTISDVRRDNMGHSKAKLAFNGMLQSALEVTREIGWRGMWKGLVPRLLMVSSSTALQLVTYDGFKVWVGLPTTRGVILGR
ncbi:hypothetical protein JKF63_07356 [Porcisia hertigi]|uniref:Mitochondrial carrier protein n=1 Tax=Porcisia hertigi TaxID=2761500 RepID=A0A836LKS5_9TRYP|nr:hypothetical protein JKF63_07356 [Porcisia hertigi]